MKLSIFHTTRYHYSAPLRHTVQMLHLWPTSGPWQTVDFWAIKAPATVHGRLDGFGNQIHQFSLAVPANAAPVLSAEIEANGIVHTHGVSLVTDLPHMPHPAVYLRSTPMSEAHPRLAGIDDPAPQIIGRGARHAQQGRRDQPPGRAFSDGDRFLAGLQAFAQGLAQGQQCRIHVISSPTGA